MRKSARDVMTRNVIVVDKDAHVKDLIAIFLEHKISCVPVVDKKKKLVGIVTKTDILGHLLDFDIDLTLQINLKDILKKSSDHSDYEISSISDLIVCNIMTSNPITASENATVKSLANTMIDNNIHRLIIVDDDDIVGIVSTIDMMYYAANKDKKDNRKTDGTR